MQICYPPSHFESFHWTSEKDGIYPKEIGYIVKSSPSPEIRSVDVVVEFSKVFSPHIVCISAGTHCVIFIIIL